MAPKELVIFGGCAHSRQVLGHHLTFTPLGEAELITARVLAKLEALPKPGVARCTFSLHQDAGRAADRGHDGLSVLEMVSLIAAGRAAELRDGGFDCDADAGVRVYLRMQPVQDAPSSTAIVAWVGHQTEGPGGSADGELMPSPHEGPKKRGQGVLGTCCQALPANAHRCSSFRTAAR
jgi:hypothetical protein